MTENPALSGTLSGEILQVREMIVAIPQGEPLCSATRDAISEHLDVLASLAQLQEREVLSLRTVLMSAVDQAPDTALSKEIIRNIGGLQ